jgi:hypothetical protein
MRTHTIFGLIGSGVFALLPLATCFAEGVDYGKRDGGLGSIEVYHKLAVDSAGQENTEGRYVITLTHVSSCPRPLFKKDPSTPMTTLIVCGKDKKTRKEVVVGTYYAVTLRQVVDDGSDVVKGYFQAQITDVLDKDGHRTYGEPYFHQASSTSMAIATP